MSPAKLSLPPLLPPPGHRARRLALVILGIAPFLFGALALWLGQDANWDLRNYHWYNAYAFINGRYGFDLLPSQTPYFYNPTLDVPFYLLATHMPAMLAGFILATVQGLNFILLFMLAYVSLIIPNPRHKVLACAFLAALGMLGGGAISLLGTTFYDNITSLGLFASALFVVRYYDQLLKKRWQRAFTLAFLFGIPSGLMMGLKLPCFVFCLGLCFAFLLAGGPLIRRVMLGFSFGLGVLGGLAVTLGHWAWYLQSHFGSPLFPYFNGFFKSSLAPLTSARDVEFLPQSLREYILYPFLFTDSPYRVGEIPWRDWRLVILYVLLPAAVALRLCFGRARNKPDAIVTTMAARYLLWASVIAYFGWLYMFCVYRYATPLEMLAPLLIVFAVGLLPLKLQTRALMAGFLLIVIAASIQPGNWFRRSAWLDHFVEVKRPELGDVSQTMLLMAGFEPYSHVLTQFPPEMPVVRIQSNFASPDQDKGINAMIHARIDAHQGRFLLLIPPWQKAVGDGALGYFRLALAHKPCQSVIDRLFDDKPLDLCEVVRTTH